MIDLRENAKWTVYAHINKINGKIYIGQTSRENPEQRWGINGKGYNDAPRFWNAIQKYGWNNFDHEIIASHLTKEEANDFEIKLIKELKTQDSNYGYNMSAGGVGPTGIKLTPEQIERTAAPQRKPICQFDLNMNFIKEFPSCTAAAKALETSVSNISGCAKGGCLTAKGYVWVYKDKLCDFNKKEYLMKIKNMKQKIPVIQLSPDMEFVNEYPSIYEASLQCNLFNNNIYECIIGKTVTCGGYIWVSKDKYLKAKKDGSSLSRERQIPNARPICQFTMDMQFIKEYSCIGEASRATGANNGEISRCASGKVYSAKKFRWMYADDYKKVLDENVPIQNFIKVDSPVQQSKSKREFKHVLQFTLDMEFIQEYFRVADASEATGIEKNKIRSACAHCGGASGGFRWKYKE